MIKMDEHIKLFETKIAEFYGAKYGISTDCCTHAIELCLRLTGYNNVTCPKHTYLSIPMTFCKLGLSWQFHKENWKDSYVIGGTNIIDGAVLWEPMSYRSGTLLCLSFQFKKHLNLGRGGMILTDDTTAYNALERMRYDGRSPNIPWMLQNVATIGYHYYMTPETAMQGLSALPSAKLREAKKWSFLDYPDLSTMEVFNGK
jgi:dTDP-4-amino-4,6-dideoxygalactose transaminase